jgi:hypothetical protein
LLEIELERLVELFVEGRDRERGETEIEAERLLRILGLLDELIGVKFVEELADLLIGTLIFLGVN